MLKCGWYVRKRTLGSKDPNSIPDTTITSNVTWDKGQYSHVLSEENVHFL